MVNNTINVIISHQVYGRIAKRLCSISPSELIDTLNAYAKCCVGPEVRRYDELRRTFYVDSEMLKEVDFNKRTGGAFATTYIGNNTYVTRSYLFGFVPDESAEEMEIHWSYEITEPEVR